MTSDDNPGATTPDRILDEAIPLFAERGFAGTSVRLVGTAADVNVATLAYHFGDKEGLYNACIERIYEKLASVGTLRLVAGPDPMAAAAAAAWAFAKEHRVHIRLLHRHLLDRGQHHPMLGDRWLDRVLVALEPVFDILGPSLPPVGRRLVLFSVMHLLVRFALEDPADLAHFLGVTPARVDPTVEVWLGRAARSLLSA